MKTNLVLAALACAALAFTSTAAMAAENPIPGVDIIVKKNGLMVTQMQSDGSGQIVLKGLAPGQYEIIIKGDSLIRAMDRLASPAKKSGGSFSIGVGGVFGGGSKHSSSGHEGADQTGHDSGGSRSSGGASVGMSVPLSGGGNPDTNPMAPGIDVAVNAGGMKFSSTTPYCRETAGGGIRIGFTIWDEASAGNIAMRPVNVTVNIFDRWGQSPD